MSFGPAVPNDCERRPSLKDVKGAETWLCSGFEVEGITA